MQIPEGIKPGVQTGDNVLKLLEYARDNSFGWHFSFDVFQASTSSPS